MPNPNRPITRHTNLTPEAFREIAESAVEELYANCDTFECHDLITWTRKLKMTLGKVSDHQSSADVLAGSGGGGEEG